MPLHDDLDSVDRILSKKFPLNRFDDVLCIKVGSIAIQAQLPKGCLEVLIPRYEGFLWSGKHDFLVEAENNSNLDLDEYKNILVKSRPGALIHYIFRWDFIARIDVSKKYACILIGPAGHPLAIDSIFRIATSFVAIEKGGFLLHSAAIISKGKAYIFAGVSGSGKSTIAKLSMDTKDVLTDEMTLIEKNADGYNVWGTPFWGELQMSRNAYAPLETVFILSQADYNAIVKLNTSIFIMEFMRVILFFGESYENYNTIINQVISFKDKVSIKELKFLPNESFWEVIDDKT